MTSNKSFALAIFVAVITAVMLYPSRPEILSIMQQQGISTHNFDQFFAMVAAIIVGMSGLFGAFVGWLVKK